MKQYLTKPVILMLTVVILASFSTRGLTWPKKTGLKIYGYLWATNTTPAIGKQVILFDGSTGKALAVTQSNFLGKYKFKNLKPGFYVVRTGKYSRSVMLQKKNANIHFNFSSKDGNMDFVAAARENSDKMDATAATAATGPTDPALAKWIAGEYYSYQGSTERKLMLCPGGVFYDSHESSYSGSSTDSLGNQTSAFGAANQGSGSGRWAIQGNKQSGTITFSYKGKAGQKQQYRAIGDNCFMIGGVKYCYNGAPRCK